MTNFGGVTEVAERVLRRVAREYKQYAYAEEYGGKTPNARQLREDHGHRFRVRHGALEVSQTFFYSNATDCSHLRTEVVRFAAEHGVSLVCDQSAPLRERHSWPKESWATYRLRVA